MTDNKVGDNGLWVSNQKQIDLLGPTTKTYGPQHSAQRPEFAKYQSQIQQQNLNGYMYGHHVLLTDQDNMNQRGFLLSEQIQNLHRSNEFDGLTFYGSQNQGLIQPVQQQSGFNDIQHLQQQLMLKKMQELQRQKNMQQRAHQQVDQSLYGLPVSNPTGPLNPYPVISTYGNSFTGNQYSFQESNNWINMDQIQQTKPTHETGFNQVFDGPQNLIMSPSEITSLDPEEEKILFGSDENIWDAFGSDKESNFLDDNEFVTELPSIQSGSWSALMQSAVAETTELTGLTSQNLQGGGQFGQLPSNIQQLNYWKNVESSVKSQNNLNQVSESSIYSSDKEDVKMHEIESRIKRENSIDSYQSTSSRQLITDRLTSSQLKFQYHPMGNLDEDVLEMPYGKRQNTTTHAISLQSFSQLRGQNQENFGNPKISSQVSKVDQNMLDLFQKMNQSRTHLNSSEHNLSSENHESDYLSKSVSWAHISSNPRETGQPVLPFSPNFQETGHAGFKNNNIGSLGAIFPVSKSQLQNHQMIASRNQLNIVESTSVKQEAENRGNLFLPQNVLSAKIDQGQSQTTSQIDFEAFGRSLKANNIHHNMDHDPFNRETKRLKRSNSILNSQNESQSSDISNNATYIKLEHSQISPQMAPTWFDKYGTFKADPLPETMVKVKSTDQPFNVEKHSGGLRTHEQVVDVSKSRVPTLVELEHGPALLVRDSGVQNVVNLIPKKRVLTTVGFYPWKVEVSGSFKNLKGICTGAVEWSRATNRMMEKVDDNGDIIEDKLAISRPKKGLILTSLLMQQLFRPPPPTILSLNVMSNYESVVYYVARLALGDACNLVSSATSYSSTSLDGENCQPDKAEQSECIVDHRLSKLIKDFTSKAEKLKDDFQRLDKRTSILDLRLEFQDLERFSVINRFARFHGRGQSDVTGTSSSDAPAHASKPFLQRYVTSVQFPANIPDRVQCLSL